jgi:Putative transposase of IS4/5 family (DUF4096)
MDLTDQQWTIIEPLFEEKRRPDGRGRPWRDARAVLNGVLWVLRTGAPCHDLPDLLPAVPDLPSAVPAVTVYEIASSVLGARSPSSNQREPHREPAPLRSRAR